MLDLKELKVKDVVKLRNGRKLKVITIQEYGDKDKQQGLNEFRNFFIILLRGFGYQTFSRYGNYCQGKDSQFDIVEFYPFDSPYNVDEVED